MPTVLPTMFPTSRPSSPSSSSLTPPKKRQRYNKENDINYVNKNNGGDNSNPLPTDWTNICCGGGVCSSSHPSSSAAPLSPQQLPPPLPPLPSSTAPLSATKARKPLQTASTNKLHQRPATSSSKSRRPRTATAKKKSPPTSSSYCERLIQSFLQRWLNIQPEIPKYKELATRFGFEYVPWDTRATSWADIWYVWAMNFPPEKEGFIVDQGLLYLGGDGLPKSRCQHTNFLRAVQVLQRRFGMDEDDAKAYILDHTLVINRLLCNGPSEWKNDKDTKDNYLKFCEESDKLVGPLTRRLMEMCFSAKAAVLFGSAAQCFYENMWIGNNLIVNKTVLPHALQQGTGWNSQEQTVNVLAAHETAFSRDPALTALPSTDEDDMLEGIPYRNKDRNTCKHCHTRGSYVDTRKKRKNNKDFVVCNGLQMSANEESKQYFLHLDVACVDCFLLPKVEGKTICSVCWEEKNRCTHEGCGNRIINNGVCIRHGAKVYTKTCSHDGCDKNAVNNGVCVKHGAKVKVYYCSHPDGCNNQVQNGGVCFKHGAKAKVKLCTHVDPTLGACTNYAVNGGVCIKHGANLKKKLCNEEMKKGPWSAEEDQKLKDLVAKYGTKKWSLIANDVPGEFMLVACSVSLHDSLIMIYSSHPSFSLFILHKNKRSHRTTMS